MGKINHRDIAIKLLMESISIIMAVLLALAANQAYGAYKRHQLAVRTTNSIYDELAINLEKLRTSHRHHEAQLTEFQRVTSGKSDMSPDQVSLLEVKIYGEGIYRPALLTKTNWDIAKFINIAPAMAVGELQAFGAVFEIQDRYIDFSHNINETDAVTLLLKPDPLTEARLIASHLNRLWWFERRLIDAIESTLKSRKTR